MIITISPIPRPRNYFAVLIDGEMIGQFPSLVQATAFAEKYRAKYLQKIADSCKIRLDIADK